jgi:uncharacterized membrane protein
LLVAFVLTKQNRMSFTADRRDDLGLQVNLLTERKATQIIQMLDRLSLHVGVNRHLDADSPRSSTWLMRWSADCRTHHAATGLRNAEHLWLRRPQIPAMLRNGR